MVTEIFPLRYVPVEELENMLLSVFNIDRVYSDRRLNRLVIQAPQGQMKDVQNMIEAMDVNDSRLAKIQAFQNFLYRIYMFEIPSKDKGNKSFSMILQTSAQLPSTKLLGVAAEKGIQISDFLVSNEERDESDQQVEFLIQGKAPSNESIKQMVEGIAESRIKELKWDDNETFTRGIEAAQYSQLPEQVQKHIKKFLGEDIETVGYWFGSSSVPGEIEAPIGPWMLRLGLNAESDRELDLRVKVEAAEQMSNFDRRLGRERSNEILSNTIGAKVGKPIIIGYNRESYGTRKMGAMVIVPEADIIQLEKN
ncbi:MAG: hypothetical protein A2168_01525 [Planctomycetes bacterium RBG_13_50_24]|nr:MAG: hypothetical protein A2168_01525 [Planctomycetes bacterium RBG_13_50_24]